MDKQRAIRLLKWYKDRGGKLTLWSRTDPELLVTILNDYCETNYPLSRIFKDRGIRFEGKYASMWKEKLATCIVNTGFPSMSGNVEVCVSGELAILTEFTTSGIHDLCCNKVVFYPFIALGGVLQEIVDAEFDGKRTQLYLPDWFRHMTSNGSYKPISQHLDFTKLQDAGFDVHWQTTSPKANYIKEMCQRSFHDRYSKSIPRFTEFNPNKQPNGRYSELMKNWPFEFCWRINWRGQLLRTLISSLITHKWFDREEDFVFYQNGKFNYPLWRISDIEHFMLKSEKWCAEENLYQMWRKKSMKKNLRDDAEFDLICHLNRWLNDDGKI